MKTLLLYHPNEGNGKFTQVLDLIVSRFQETDQHVTLYRLNNLSKLEQMLENLNASEYGKVLIAGGDGTLNHCINCLLKQGINLPIGIYPLGTVNDFAQSFGLLKSFEELTEIYVRNNLTPSDVGFVNGRYFLNVASMGFLNEISQRTDTGAKSSLGVLAYYLKGLEELPDIKPISIAFETDDQQWQEEVFCVLALNGISAGGFRRIAPLAALNDGLLDIIIFKKSPRRELIQVILQMMSGARVSSPNVSVFQAARLVVTSPEALTVDLDGEKGSTFPLEISVQQSAIRILTQRNNECPLDEDGALSFREVKRAFDGVTQSLTQNWLKAIDLKELELGTTTGLNKLVSDLPKHNALSYVNRRTLEDGYFKSAEATLDNGYMYLVLSSTGTAAGEIIRKVTGKEYSHSSLSFDEGLETIVSYNGGNQIYSPGMNMETIEFFYQKPDANILTYRLKASRIQKQAILDAIKEIDSEGSSYNVLGLFVPYSHKENIMFCSQFVYIMLKCGGLSYFDKKPEEVKPTDFVELDYRRVLEYCGQIFLKDVTDAKQF